MGRAVKVALEGHSGGVYLTRIAQTINLESTTVGQDWPVPGHEIVQAAQVANKLISRSQVEMVSVCQDQGSPQLFQIGRTHRFDRGLGANGSKHGGWDDAMRGVELPCTRSAIGIACQHLEIKHGGYYTHRVSPHHELTALAASATMLANNQIDTLFIQRGGGTDPTKPQQPPPYFAEMVLISAEV